MDFCFPIYVLELWQVGSRLTRRKYRNTTDLSHSRQERRTTHRRQTGHAAKRRMRRRLDPCGNSSIPIRASTRANLRRPGGLFPHQRPSALRQLRASSSTCPNLPGLNLVKFVVQVSSKPGAYYRGFERVTGASGVESARLSIRFLPCSATNQKVESSSPSGRTSSFSYGPSQFARVSLSR